MSGTPVSGHSTRAAGETTAAAIQRLQGQLDSQREAAAAAALAATQAEAQRAAAMRDEMQRATEAIVAREMERARAGAAAGQPPAGASSPFMQKVDLQSMFNHLRTPAPVPVAPAPFAGGNRDMKAEYFLRKVAQYHRATRTVLDTDKLELIGNLLEGVALDWWSRTQLLDPAHADAVTTWAQFAAVLRTRYLPVNIDLYARTQLAHLAGQSRSDSSSWAEQFRALVEHVSGMDTGTQMFLFRSGLPAVSKEKFSTKEYDTLDALTQAVLTWESQRAYHSSHSGAPAGGGAPSARGVRFNLMSDELYEEEPLAPYGQPLPFAEMPPTSIMAQLSAITARLNKRDSETRWQPRGGSDGSRSSGSGGGGGRQRSERIPGLSGELARARAKANLCVKCGKSGHWKNECPNRADVSTAVPSGN